MKKYWKKLLSGLLCLVLTLSPILPNVAYAASSVSEGWIEIEPVNQPLSIEEPPYTEEDSVAVTIKDAQILYEDVSKRDKYTKEFIMSDRSRLLVVYPDAVHYENNGKWADIDNTLKTSADSKYPGFKNTAGIWDVYLPSSFTPNESNITIKKEDKVLSFGAGVALETETERPITKPTPDPEIMIQEPETEIKEEPIQEPETEIKEEPITEQESIEIEDTTSPEGNVLEESRNENEPSETEINQPGSDEVQENGEEPQSQIPEESVAAENTDPIEEEHEEPQNDPAKNTETESVVEIRELVGRTSLATTITSFEQRNAMDSIQRRTISEKLHTGLKYSNIYNNIDLEYRLTNETVKENIILNEKPEEGTIIRFPVTTENVNLVLKSDGSIWGISDDSDTPDFVMPAPYMFDANGEHCSDIQVELEKTEDGWEIIYYPADDWLQHEERVYPVTIDPVVTPALTTGNIRDKQVDEKKDDVSQTSSYIEAGYHSTYGIERIYLMYRDLPVLTSADVLTNAKIQLYRPYNSSTSSQMNVHKVSATWDSATLQWSNKPGYNTSIEDYAIVGASGWYTWDVTDIARDWYQKNSNTGMMFKLTDAIEKAKVSNNKTFCSSDGGSAERPVLYISYVSGSGLENYWNYHSQNAGRAGTGYVNDYTGNLVWVHSGLSAGGTRAGISIDAIYNANDRSNRFGIGNGWRTNFNQLVYAMPNNSSYYIWEDEDGTLHYFKNVSSGTYKDESGLELTLTTTGTGNNKYCIADKNGNKSYFDTTGRLTRIINNQSTKTTTTVTYLSDTDKKISTVTDGATRVYAFSYTNNLLSKVDFRGANDTSYMYLTYSHTNSNLTGIGYQDGNSVSYTYGTNNLLIRATDVDGYNVRYAYNASSTSVPNRIIKIVEYDGNTAGGHLSISYQHNQTTYKDFLNNVEIEQFNDWGNLISIQDDEGHAQYAEYAQDSNSSAKANQLVLASKLQNTVKNYVREGSFEKSTYWRAFYNGDSGGSVGYSSSVKYAGLNSVYITRNNDNGVHLVQATTDSFAAIEPGETYTLSCYVKTTGMGGTGSGAKIAVELDGTVNPIYSKSINTNTDWTRLEVTYTHPSNAASNTMKWHVQNGSTGTAYFDCLQFEHTPTASRYNLLENSDFSYAGSSSSAAYGWTFGPQCTTSDIITTTTSAAPQLDNRVFKAIGDVDSRKRLYQTVTGGGKKGDVFTLSGWAKMDAAPNADTDRYTALMLRFYSAANEENMWAVQVPFHTDTENKWQFASKKIIADADYSKVQVLIIYEKNVNTAYFDGIQLFKEEFGQSYVYDANGNVTSVADLQAKKTTYEYANNNLTKMTLPSGASQVYTYDSYHNVKTAVSPSGVKSSFTYDAYGNPTSVLLGTDTLGIETTATYNKVTNQLYSTTDSLGNTTITAHNGNPGTIGWVQAPEDTSAERTNYSYDSIHRNTQIKKNVPETVGGNTDLAVNYTYEYDRLKTLTHTNTADKSTTYTFNYGAFGLLSSIKVGSRTLSSHTYNSANKTYDMTKLTYGNGDYINYSYDNKGRLTEKGFSDSTGKVTYAYDNNGSLGMTNDGLTGQTQKYIYDASGRTAVIEDNGDCYDYTRKIQYNANNLVSNFREEINGANFVTTYTYDNDNRPTLIMNGRASTAYTYDSLSRLSLKTYRNAGTPSITYTPTYVSNPTDATRTSAQIATWKVQAKDYETTLSYAYDGNGNITQITEGGKSTTYVYDGINQLIRENNQAAGKTWTYSYDAGGNIVEKKEYAYTTGTLGTVLDTITYGYTDEDWGDLLTSYDGNTITSDNIGNMLSDGTWTYTWKNGRQLASMTNGTTTASFTYNGDGIRSTKTANGKTWQYTYDGDKLTHMYDGTRYLHFRYEGGRPFSFYYNNGTDTRNYYYLWNAQGDCIGITSADGTHLVEYTYDAWGNITSITGISANTLALYNPFRYRGYVYDDETGLYYLQSRYYNPEMGRFINADSQLEGVGGGILGANLFAYCVNNPINYLDYSGKNPIIFPLVAESLSSVVGATLGAAATGYAAGKGIENSIQKARARWMIASLLVYVAAAHVKNITENSVVDEFDKYSVYTMRHQTTKDVKYIGITKNPPKRQSQHNKDRKKADLEPMEVRFTGMSRLDARAMEQLLISAYSIDNLYNARREIAQKNVSGFANYIGNIISIFGSFGEDVYLDLMRR